MARDSASRANNPSPDADAEPTSGPARGAAPAGDRSGQDERRRGWFWHWNGIVTQYTPLIGLKGIGLLNSYTVWTDRREDSPHRGYAFPSQQSEANFYGEDRAELITINKILVALDLIEIRKEMVRKTDEQGRRWKVPQNLYRVKDRQDGLDLTAADVIRVIELADKDKAVYRYIRKLFSSRFEPIDRNNVWHAILAELADHPTWQKLAARAAKQEARASARTKAGHRSRARQQEQAQADEADAGDQAERETDSISPERQSAANAPSPLHSAAEMTDGQITNATFSTDEHGGTERAQATTTDAPVNSGLATTAEESNNGLKAPDEPGNNGSGSPERGSVARSNNGRESSVEPGNTMYYQSSPTTTTTTTSPAGDVGESTTETAAVPGRQDDDRGVEGQGSPGARGARPDHEPATPATADGDLLSEDADPGGGAAEPGVDRAAGAGPVGDPSPLALSLYEAANDRAATRLERILLSELETDAAAPAAAAGSSGPEWVAAALREAVGSGSAFVAPKRIREIINRWAASGSGPRGARVDESRHEQSVYTSRGHMEVKQELEERRGEQAVSAALRVSREDAAQGDRLWGVVLDMLAAGDGCDDLFRLRGVVPLGEREDGAFVLGAPTRVSARLLDGRHRRPVEQALASLLSSPASIAVLDPDEWTIEA